MLNTHLFLIEILILIRVWLMYVLRVYINNFVFEKILLGIEKAVKIFSVLDKTFSKNDILLCVLRTYDTKILLIM